MKYAAAGSLFEEIKNTKLPLLLQRVKLFSEKCC
jgi:hypothetical protein